MHITRPVDLSLRVASGVLGAEGWGHLLRSEQSTQGSTHRIFQHKRVCQMEAAEGLCTVQCITQYIIIIIIQQDSSIDICILAHLLHLLLLIIKNVCASKSLSTHSNSEVKSNLNISARIFPMQSDWQKM